MPRLLTYRKSKIINVCVSVLSDKFIIIFTQYIQGVENYFELLILY